jgi:DNA-binding MarR family transcriptional regulator
MSGYLRKSLGVLAGRVVLAALCEWQACAPKRRRTLAIVLDSDRDEVDRLVDAWRRERPELDVSPMEVLSRVTRLAKHLDIARREAFSDQDLEIWEFDVLSALRRSGPPYQLSPGQLLRETLVTSGTMTNRVDRMASRDLVERLPHPDDRRGVLVRLTDAGRISVDAALDQLLARERALLDGLQMTDTAQLAASLRVLTIRFDTR